MKKSNGVLTAVFIVVIAVSLALSAMRYMREPDAPEPIVNEVTEIAYISPAPDVAFVRASEQTEAERPPGFADPKGDWVVLPDSKNLAENKPVSAGEVTDVYAVANAVDGDTGSYWESKGWPAEITIDLEDVFNISTVAVLLNPVPLWEPRSQKIIVSAGTDASNLEIIVPETQYDFHSDSGNIVRIDFNAVSARYVTLTFTASSASRTGGAQAAEIQVYE